MHGLGGLLLVMVLFADVGAIPARRCRLGCDATIQQCVRDGFRKRFCKRHWVRVCRVQGVGVCLPTTTTSTAPPGTTSPTAPGKDSTTTSTSSSTTTTLLNAAGVWRFDGALTLNSCGFGSVKDPLSGTLTLLQSGAVLYGDLDGLYVTGELVGTGWELHGSEVCTSSCCLAPEIHATNQSGGFANGTVLNEGTCDGDIFCALGWTGTLRRQD